MDRQSGQLEVKSKGNGHLLVLRQRHEVRVDTNSLPAWTRPQGFDLARYRLPETKLRLCMCRKGQPALHFA